MARILALVFTLAVSISFYAGRPPISRREKALQGINACLRRNEVSSRECKPLNHDVETLVDLYRGGNKSVLPTLFQFTYLTDFYDEALLSDPDGFLTALTQLPPKGDWMSRPALWEECSDSMTANGSTASGRC
jgi:hypothetical protein